MRYLPIMLPLALFAAMPAFAGTAPARHAGGHGTGAPAALTPVPEPAIWSTMIAGIGFAGASLRRARRWRSPGSSPHAGA